MNFYSVCNQGSNLSCIAMALKTALINIGMPGVARLKIYVDK